MLGYHEDVCNVIRHRSCIVSVSIEKEDDKERACLPFPTRNHLPALASPSFFSLSLHSHTHPTLIMAKGSSASSGTRKKNQAKKIAKLAQTDPNAAADLAQQPLKTATKGSGPKLNKRDKAAQKVKRGVAKPYTPPPKPPAPAVPDPLESMGLSASLPGGLVVVLRKLGKKDEVTRRRALEDLQTWLLRVKKEGADDITDVDSKEQLQSSSSVDPSDQQDEGEEVEGSDGWWIDVIGPVWVSFSYSFPVLFLSRAHSMMRT